MISHAGLVKKLLMRAVLIWLIYLSACLPPCLWPHSYAGLASFQKPRMTACNFATRFLLYQIKIWLRNLFWFTLMNLKKIESSIIHFSVVFLSLSLTGHCLGPAKLGKSYLRLINLTNSSDAIVDCALQDHLQKWLLKRERDQMKKKLEG